MKLRILRSFGDKLNGQVDYIAQDKPGAARKFKSDILKRIKEIPKMPYANRKSIFFDREDIRDLVFKGYIVVYKVDDRKESLQYSDLRNTKMIHLKSNYYWRLGKLHLPCHDFCIPTSIKALRFPY